MAIEHISKFITDLAMHFSPPRFDQEHERQAWQKSIMLELHGTSPDVLERAARIIIQTRKNRYFPLIAECRQAVREAAEEKRFDEHSQTLPDLRKAVGGYSKAREEFVENQMLHCELGRQAAREGWILACRDFAVRENRLPDNRRYEPRNKAEREEFAGCSEIEFCKRSAKGFDEAYDAVLRGGGGDLHSKLEKLGDAMAAKREKLRQEVLGR